MHELEVYRANVERRANEEAIVLLEEAKKKVQSVGDELKELRKKDQIQASVGLSDLKKDLDGAIGRVKPKKKTVVQNNEPLSIGEINPGDEVYLLNYNMNATVLSVNKSKKTLDVQAGIMKSTVKLSDVKRATKAQRRQSVSTSRRSMKVKSVHSEIDLRGMTVDEALAATDRFIDEAYLNNLSQVHIIHGKGTGALRKAIKEKLAASKYIKEYHLAPANEGGDGATVAILK